MKAATADGGVVCALCMISIHAAREGGDWNAANTKAREVAFQSTPPVKAATTRESHVLLDGEISIHAAREGGDRKRQGYRLPRRISIHAAREGGDAHGILERRGQSHFNPRRP